MLGRHATSYIVNGINWVITTTPPAARRGQHEPGRAGVDGAGRRCEAMIADGITVVVAAGNEASAVATTARRGSRGDHGRRVDAKRRRRILLQLRRVQRPVRAR